MWASALRRTWISHAYFSRITHPGWIWLRKGAGASPLYSCICLQKSLYQRGYETACLGTGTSSVFELITLPLQNILCFIVPSIPTLEDERWHCRELRAWKMTFRMVFWQFETFALLSSASWGFNGRQQSASSSSPLFFSSPVLLQLQQPGFSKVTQLHRFLHAGDLKLRGVGSSLLRWNSLHSAPASKETKPIRSSSSLAHLPCALAGEKLKLWRSEKQSEIGPSLSWKHIYWAEGTPNALIRPCGCSCLVHSLVFSPASHPGSCFPPNSCCCLPFPPSLVRQRWSWLPPSPGLGAQCKDTGAYPSGLARSVILFPPALVLCRLRGVWCSMCVVLHLKIE